MTSGTTAFRRRAPRAALAGTALLALTVTGCGSEEDSAAAAEPTATVTAAEWWDAVCPTLVEQNESLRTAIDAQPTDPDLTEEQVGRAATELGAEAEAYRTVADELAATPHPEPQEVTEYIDIAIRRNGALADQLHELQEQIRDAETPEDAGDIWYREAVWSGPDFADSELAGVIGSYGAEAEDFVDGQGSQAERLLTEFGASLEGMPDCADAWDSFAP